jgi:hypothetical protein
MFIETYRAESPAATPEKSGQTSLATHQTRGMGNFSELFK